MKKILLILGSCLLVFTIVTHGQGSNFGWMRHIGTRSNLDYSSMDLDQYGNIYATGNFHDTVDFDPSNNVSLGYIPNGDAFNVFITKYNTNGDFIWAKCFGSSSSLYSSYSTSLTVGNDNCIYVSGFFEGDIDFDPSAGTYFDSGVKCFVAKYDSSGNFVWAKSISNGSYEIHGVALDNQSNVYYTARYNGAFDVDRGGA